MWKALEQKGNHFDWDESGQFKLMITLHDSIKHSDRESKLGISLSDDYLTGKRSYQIRRLELLKCTLWLAKV